MPASAPLPLLDDNPIAPLGREEYVEQAHFFATLRDRLKENVPAQEVLKSVREETLATTKLPMAIDFLLLELRHTGAFGPAMERLTHYFTPFQSFVVNEGENERGRFDMRIGLAILSGDALYRLGDDPRKPPSRQGLFLYQFEAICRNRLGYDQGLAAVADDPGFDAPWRNWILSIRHQVGMVDIADLIYVHSEHYVQQAGPRAASFGDGSGSTDDLSVLFGEREGRIALANRRKDPLHLFNSFHRQLGYPAVPRPPRASAEGLTLPQLARRLEQFEKRIALLEEEQRGGVDLTKLYQPPPEALE